MGFSPYIKNIDRIEFIVTYHCTGRCRHCSVGEQLGKNQDGFRSVDAEAAADAVRQLAGLFSVKSLMTFGGEPLLYPEITRAIHAAAKECGIARRQVITNGFFSRSEDRIRQVAMELARAGVNELLLSVDAFHQERIPLAPVRLFAEAARDAGIPVRLSPAWLVDAAHENPWNRETRRILDEFRELGFPEGSGNDIFLAGNAVQNLAQYYPAPQLRMDQRCGSMPYTAPPTEVSSLSIEPNGDVIACAFVIGNIYREDLEGMLRRHDPYADRTMRAVIDGLPAMLALAKEQGIGIDPQKCYSVCDVCRALNRGRTDRSL